MVNHHPSIGSLRNGNSSLFRDRIPSLAIATIIGNCLIVVFSLATPPANGITINVVYNNANSVEPATDPTGTLLTNIVQSAANRWQDIIEDNFTMTINIWWDTAPNVNNALAIAPIVSPNGANNRTVTGNILFNRTSNFFLDTTPSQDNEYAFTQTLFRDLSAANQANMYNVTTNQQLLEAGFVGTALASAPAQAQTGIDMLSVALHELGHHLGVTNQLTGAVSEWQTDSDYDLPPSLINGRVIAARTGDNFGHLAGGGGIPSLMQPTVPFGGRRLPSATDVFSAAAVGNWTSIDLQRQDLLGGSTWNNASAWEGAQVPGSADSAFLRLGGTINLDINDSVASLLVGDSTNFRTGVNRIDVSRTTTIDFDGSFPFAQIFVETGGELETDDLVINGGELDMEGGLADIQSTLTVNKVITGGNITGFGTVDVQGKLSNNGLISAGDDATLTFSSTSVSDVFDLDGDGSGELRAISGDILVTGNVFPTFAGDMTVDAGRFIQIDDTWRLASGGVVDLDGGTTTATEADLRGGEIQIDGTINVDKRAELDVPASFNASANVNLPDSDDRLELGTSRSQAIVYKGASFTGNGTLVQNGDATVPIGASQTIGVGNFDWDGSTISSTTLLSGSELIVAIGTLNDTHDGDINLTNAMLSVTTTSGSWDYDGTMTFNPGGFGTSPVNGSTMNVTANGLLHFQAGTGVVNPQVGMSGDMLVEGIADFNDSISFASGSTTTLASGGILRFNANTLYSSSTISGTGSIQQNGTGFIVNDQTITLTGIFDWDGASNNSQFFVNPGKTFTLNATTINPGNNLYSGSLTLIAGTLIVDVAADLWTMAGTLNMTGAIGQAGGILGDPVDITGDVHTNTSGVHTFATISRFLAGSTSSVAANTELRFNAPVTWEDGTHSGAGIIGINDTGTVNGGTIDIAELQIGGSATMTVNGGSTTATDFVKQAGGSLVFDGGDFTVDGGTGTFNSSFLYSGPSDPNQPTFNVVSGADVAYTFAWRVGETAGEFGALLVTGSGGGQASTLRATGGGGGADVVVALNGTGTMEVTAGGHVIAGDDFIIGRNTGSDGTATVSGVAAGFRSTVSATRNNEADNDLMIGGGEGATMGDGLLNVLNGALVELSGRVRLAETPGATAHVNISGSTGGFPAELNVAQNIFVGGIGGTVGGTANINLNGGGKLTGNQMTVYAGSNFNFNGGELNLNTLDIATNGGAFNMIGGVLHVETFDGDLEPTGGTVAPGASPGTTVVAGMFDLGSGATLEIEIGGLTAGTQFDLLEVNGGANLIGTLDIELIDLGIGYTPAEGHSFEIVTAVGGITNQFSVFDEAILPTGLAWDLSYGTNSVVLSIIAAGLLGDYNGNGIVDAADYTVWLDNLGGTTLLNDPTPGTVDQSDYAFWKANFGATSGTGTSKDASIPEPGTLALAVFALLALSQSKRRQ